MFGGGSSHGAAMTALTRRGRHSMAKQMLSGSSHQRQKKKKRCGHTPQSQPP